MTNAAIILDHQLYLMEQGKIGTTGRMFEAVTVDADGNETRKLLPEPEPIHTFQHWKALGYSVKKGEHAVAKFAIWKHSAKKETDENGEELENSSMFMKVAHFFALSQVEARE